TANLPWESRLMKYSILAAALFVGIALASGLVAQEAGPNAAQRGAAAVRGQPPMNPSVWSAQAYDNIWKQWGLTEKPADFDRAVRERSGLHPALYANGGLPMGLHYSKGLLGKGVVNDCLLCHAGVVAGQTVIGAPNASLDLQGLMDDLTITDK